MEQARRKVFYRFKIAFDQFGGKLCLSSLVGGECLADWGEIEVTFSLLTIVKLIFIMSLKGKA
jgi:hypothetical protein